jgi:hypothetical protein
MTLSELKPGAIFRFAASPEHSAPLKKVRHPSDYRRLDGARFPLTDSKIITGNPRSDVVEVDE